MNKNVFLYKYDRKEDKWYLTFDLGSSNFCIPLSKSEMKMLSKGMK